VADGDEGAAEIYDLKDHAAEFVTTDIARAIVDLNRAEDDRRPDGVVIAVTTNEPFSGGYITRLHGKEHPWLQLEISRAPFMSNAEKRLGVLRALTDFCEKALT
jgi:N-formylglutamate amidohydrolase